MTEVNLSLAATADDDRLVRAERQGLRLAIICRTIAVGAAFIWVTGAWAFLSYKPSPWVFIALFGFTALGVFHLSVMNTRFDRLWIKYLVYTVDALGICAGFALIPVSFGEDVPQIIAFRAYGIYYLFPLVAMSALSLSAGLVLWSGIIAVAGWWAAFLFVIADMETRLSWADMPVRETREAYETVFLSADFIGRGNRVEETGFLFIATAILALSVWRARRVFLAQIAAQADRERIAATLGRYVPEAIAKRLIDDPEALTPQERQAAIVVMDVAGFTAFSAGRAPQDVIETLNAFLAGAAEAVSAVNGVVIQFTGDGLVASFGTPLESETPEKDAITAAKKMVELARSSDFSIRVGIATGSVASGSIGSADRKAFTVYGETVNRAARLEALGKTLEEAIVLDEATAVLVRDHASPVDYGAHQIPGLAVPIRVFGISTR